jgi:hypothetical protein
LEIWKAGIAYPCMTGDIARTAELTIHELLHRTTKTDVGAPQLRAKRP